MVVSTCPNEPVRQKGHRSGQYDAGAPRPTRQRQGAGQPHSETVPMLAQVPNLFYVIGLPIALMAVSGVICLVLLKGLERILPP